MILSDSAREPCVVLCVCMCVCVCVCVCVYMYLCVVVCGDESPVFMMYHNNVPYVTVYAKTFHKSAKFFLDIRVDFASPIFNLLSLQILHGEPIPLPKYGYFYTAMTATSLL